MEQRFIHRVVRSGTEESDTTYLVAQVYDPETAAVDNSARLCSPDTGECFERGPGAHISGGDSLGVQFCRPSELSLRWQRGELRLWAERPPPMVADVDTRRLPDGSRVVSIDTSLNPDRVLAEIVDLEHDNRRTWSTESKGAAMRVGARIQITIPAAQMRCAERCELRLHALAILATETTPAFSEALLTTSLGALP